MLLKPRENTESSRTGRRVIIEEQAKYGLQKTYFIFIRWKTWYSLGFRNAETNWTRCRTAWAPHRPKLASGRKRLYCIVLPCCIEWVGWLYHNYILILCALLYIPLQTLRSIISGSTYHPQSRRFCLPSRPTTDGSPYAPFWNLPGYRGLTGA
jgi:hypothetical protein